MDKEPDILDIIQYGLNRKSLQENNPEKFLELEKYFQNEDNKKKFFETDLEMDWDDELSKSSQYPKPEKLNLKKNSILTYFLPLAAIFFFGVNVFLFIGRVLRKDQSISFSFADTTTSDSIFYSNGFMLLVFLISMMFGFIYFYQRKKK